MKFLAPKRVFASIFFVLTLFFLNISDIFLVYCANADVIYSRNNSEKANVHHKKIDEIFARENSFENFIEPKGEFSDQDGNLKSLKDLRGQFVLVYFWATWCNQCKEDLKLLQKLNDELNYRSIKEIKILPISIDYKPLDKVMDSVLGVKDIEIMRDDYKELMEAFKVKSLPTTFFINKDGYVILRFENSLKWDDDYFINKLIKISGSPTPNKDSKSQIPQKEHDSVGKDSIIKPETKHKTIFIN